MKDEVEIKARCLYNSIIEIHNISNTSHVKLGHLNLKIIWTKPRKRIAISPRIIMIRVILKKLYFLLNFYLP